MRRLISRHSLFNKLLERTQIVKGLRAELEHTREQRNQWQHQYVELLDEYKGHIKYPTGMGCYFQVGVDCPVMMSDPVRRIRIAVRPVYQFIEWVMMDAAYGKHAVRYISEQVSRSIIKHIQPQIEEQLATQCNH